MSVISGAGEVLVVVAIVSVGAGAPGVLLVVDLGFLLCESLVEAVLVLVGAAMDEGRGGTETEGRRIPGFYTFASETWRNMK